MRQVSLFRSRAASPPLAVVGIISSGFERVIGRSLDFSNDKYPTGRSMGVTRWFFKFWVESKELDDAGTVRFGGMVLVFLPFLEGGVENNLCNHPT
jgi:hypothetical protein